LLGVDSSFGVKWFCGRLISRRWGGRSLFLLEIGRFRFGSWSCWSSCGDLDRGRL